MFPCPVYFRISLAAAKLPPSHPLAQRAIEVNVIPPDLVQSSHGYKGETEIDLRRSPLTFGITMVKVGLVMLVFHILSTYYCDIMRTIYSVFDLSSWHRALRTPVIF